MLIITWMYCKTVINTTDIHLKKGLPPRAHLKSLTELFMLNQRSQAPSKCSICPVNNYLKAEMVHMFHHMTAHFAN